MTTGNWNPHFCGGFLGKPTSKGIYREFEKNQVRLMKGKQPKFCQVI